MCQIRTDHDRNLLRLAAMDKRNPMFALLFGRDGKLLTANLAARRKYGAQSIGDSHIMTCDIIDMTRDS